MDVHQQGADRSEKGETADRRAVLRGIASKPSIRLVKATVNTPEPASYQLIGKTAIGAPDRRSATGSPQDSGPVSRRAGAGCGCSTTTDRAGPIRTSRPETR